VNRLRCQAVPVSDDGANHAAVSRGQRQVDTESAVRVDDRGFALNVAEAAKGHDHPGWSLSADLSGESVRGAGYTVDLKVRYCGSRIDYGGLARESNVIVIGRRRLNHTRA